MVYQRSLTVVRGDESTLLSYYVKERESLEFECKTYTVGISSEGKTKEIKDFSSDRQDSELFCEYLYRENVSLRHLFLIGEEFITERSI